MPDRRYKKLMALLDVEGAVIRRGEIDSLPNLTEQKALLMRDLAGMRVSATELARLKSAAEQNARLFAAAIAGVRDAQKRLQALDDMRSGLSIYDASGKRATVATPQNGMERKA